MTNQTQKVRNYIKILIIQHSESEADLLEVHEGRADFELTEKGHRQAQAMAEYVEKNYSVDFIFSSPLKRAAQTDTHLSQLTGIEVKHDNNLMEFNNGLLAGLSRTEAAEKYLEIIDLPVDKAIYGQESKVDFRRRADKFLNKLYEKSNRDKTIVIISHSGIINQLYALLLNSPIHTSAVISTADTGIHVWRWDGH